MSALLNIRIENIRIILIEKALNFTPNAMIARQKSSKNINIGVPINPNVGSRNSRRKSDTGLYKKFR
tara:strand:- start:797 stop:997 length:201 start_codon:yes stop_codon:yes gene_type:complete